MLRTLTSSSPAQVWRSWGKKKKLVRGITGSSGPPFFSLILVVLYWLKIKEDAPGLVVVTETAFVFCLSEIMSPSSAVLIELAVFVIAGG